MRILLKIPEHIDMDNYNEINKYLRSRYHFDIDFDFESDEWHGIYYNSDLRSHMGYLDEIGYNEFVLIIWPKYYKEGWENTYWKNLMEDCEVLEE